jgi:preprotein translocase subunit SecY
VIILVTGTIFAMWLGEKITDKGIGNGISLLIMVGIPRFPQAFIQEFTTRVTNNGGPMLLVIEIIIWLLVIVACVLLTMAIERYHSVQYARRTTSGDFEQDMMGGNRQWIPLKLNALVLCRLSLLRLSCLYLRLWLVYLSQHRSPLLALLVICSVLV